MGYKFRMVGNLICIAFSYSFDRSKTNASAGAKRFFQAIKQYLTSEDFTAARAIVVEMKSYGDKQDSSSYLRVAKDLVEILLKYETHHDGCKKWSPLSGGLQKV